MAWSYASIAWAAYRGDALSGSNKALLYLLIFTLCALSRWTPRRALWMTTAYTVAVGAVGGTCPDGAADVLVVDAVDAAPGSDAPPQADSTRVDAVVRLSSSAR